jgi:hypothetical protein
MERGYAVNPKLPHTYFFDWECRGIKDGAVPRMIRWKAS